MDDLENIFEQLYQEIVNYESNSDDNIELKIEISLSSDLFTEGSILKDTKIKNLTVNIIVRTREGENYPHCHVIETSENNGKQFHSCVCLEQAKYFIHKGKEDTFNSKQRKEFDKIMRSRLKRGDKSTVWNILVQTWNKYNRKKVEVSEIPDYTNLSGCIREGEK